jgi:hypothetical protein
VLDAATEFGYDRTDKSVRWESNNVSFQVEVDWAPAHELILSLLAFVNNQTHKVLDLGPPWVKEVRRGLPDSFLAEVQALRAVTPVPPTLALLAPRTGGIPGFLEWLQQLQVEEIWSLVVRLGGTPPPPSGLLQARDSWFRVLSIWNETYFRKLDPQILTGLQAETDALRTRAAESDPFSLVAEATSGLRVEPVVELDRVLLTPHYHYRPLNLSDWFDGWVAISYPAEILPPQEGEMARGLRRLLRALDDDSRLQMLKALAEQPLSFTEVVERSGLAKSTVHHHLVTLRAAGLVWYHATGASSDTYSLRPEALDRLSPELRTHFEGA